MRKMTSLLCNKCGNTFEKLLEEGHIVPCDKCNSMDVVRTITAPAIKVTGQGAYTNKMKV